MCLLWISVHTYSSCYLSWYYGLTRWFFCPGVPGVLGWQHSSGGLTGLECPRWLSGCCLSAGSSAGPVHQCWLYLVSLLVALASHGMDGWVSRVNIPRRIDLSPPSLNLPQHWGLPSWGPRHCGAETSCPRACLNSWPEESIRYKKLSFQSTKFLVKLSHSNIL